MLRHGQASPHGECELQVTGSMQARDLVTLTSLDVRCYEFEVIHMTAVLKLSEQACTCICCLLLCLLVVLRVSTVLLLLMLLSLCAAVLFTAQMLVGGGAGG